MRCMSKYTAPAISVIQEEDETYRLYATSHSYCEIAGPRLFRAPPHPDIKWRHLDYSEAEQDARKLREYLAECESGKRKERVGESVTPWWED